MVANMSRPLDFYLKGLNFTTKHQWAPNETIEWCWLQLDNASLMLQEYRQYPPTEKRGEGVSIYFICEDALIIYEQMIKNGLTASEPFVGNNMWVVGRQDPDGYNIFLKAPLMYPKKQGIQIG